MNQLRFSTSKPGFMGMSGEPVCIPVLIGELERCKIKGSRVYIHGEAEDLAGYDIPIFIDGNMGQLDMPVDKQDIIMLLPSGDYKCKAELQTEHDEGAYYITLVNVYPKIGKTDCK